MPTKKSPRFLFDRAHEGALFGGHFYGQFATADQARDVAAIQVYRYTDAVRRPDNGLLVIVGDFEPNQAVKLAEEVLGSWRVPSPEDRTLLAAPPLLDHVPGPHAGLNVQNQPGSTRAVVRFSCLLPATDGDTVAVTRVFEELLSARLFGSLRERERASYAVTHDVEVLRGGTTLFRAEADVDPQRLPAALSTLRSLGPSNG